MPTRLLRLLLPFLLLTGCAERDRDHKIVISIPDQKMRLYTKGHLTAEYPVSTSKYGLGDRPGSYATPLGRLEVREKIGDGAPLGAVFKSRRPTGEILRPNAPGRDPVVTRILWLNGTESCNSGAHRRFIYIHGTPEEWRIGTPASYGCIRMKSYDVAQLFSEVGKGAEVDILNAPLLPLPQPIPTTPETAPLPMLAQQTSPGNAPNKLKATGLAESQTIASTRSSAPESNHP